jgi:hypothetical protein
MLPYNYENALYEYDELTSVFGPIPWNIANQGISKESQQILFKNLSLYEFKEYSKKEIFLGMIDPYVGEYTQHTSFYFYLERPADLHFYKSQYTWTLNNAKTFTGEFVDLKWNYNKYLGWEYMVHNQLISGYYIPERIGSINWGIRSQIKDFDSNNEIEIVKNVNSLTYTINTSSIEYSAVAGVPIIIELDEDILALKISELEGDVEVYWTDKKGISETVVEDTSFILSKYLKIIVPVLVFNELEKPQGSGINYSGTGFISNTGIEEENTLTPPGYLNIILFRERLYELLDIKTLNISPLEWIVYTPQEIDILNPLPNTQLLSKVEFNYNRL